MFWGGGVWGGGQENRRKASLEKEVARRRRDGGFSSKKSQSRFRLDGPRFKGGLLFSLPKRMRHKNKNALVSQRDKGEQTLRYHSSCRTGIPFRPLKCCPVGGASGGTYSGSAPCSKVIFSASSLSALQSNGGSLCVLEAGTRPVLRIMTLFCPISYPLFP